MILENYHYFSALILSKNSLPNIQAKIRYILHFLQQIFHFKVALIWLMKKKMSVSSI